jgi:hypothetical protein
MDCERRAYAGILSYDDHPLVRRLCKGFNLHEVEKVNYRLNSRSGTTPRYRPEFIITNY